MHIVSGGQGKSSGVGEVENWTSNSTYDIFTDLNAALYYILDFPGGLDAGNPGPEDPGEANGNLLSVLTWRVPWTKEPGGLQAHGITESDTTSEFP